MLEGFIVFVIIIVIALIMYKDSKTDFSGYDPEDDKWMKKLMRFEEEK